MGGVMNETELAEKTAQSIHTHRKGIQLSEGVRRVYKKFFGFKPVGMSDNVMLKRIKDKKRLLKASKEAREKVDDGKETKTLQENRFNNPIH